MSFLKKYSEPYAEFTVSSERSEADLRQFLRENCSGYKWWFSKGKFDSFTETADGVSITPVAFQQRQSPKLYLTFEPRLHGGTIIHVSIKPANFEWIFRVHCAFSLIISIAGICNGQWLMLLFLLFPFFSLFVLKIIDADAQSKVPGIEKNFRLFITTPE